MGPAGGIAQPIDDRQEDHLAGHHGKAFGGGWQADVEQSGKQPAIGCKQRQFQPQP